MGGAQTFEDLEIWQLAREICQDVWRLINSTSLKSDYKLRGQMNASSGSMMDNIAEGFERDGNREFMHFLSIAKGSCGELRSQLYRCLDREHIDQKAFRALFDKVVLHAKKTKAFRTS